MCILYFVYVSGGVQNSNGTTLSVESLLDILIVLYEECQTPALRREKRISEFVDFGRFACFFLRRYLLMHKQLILVHL